jgi:hypothetical protein
VKRWNFLHCASSALEAFHCFTRLDRWDHQFHWYFPTEEESSVIRKNLLSISMAVIVILATSALGQNPSPPPSNDSAQVDQNIELLRKDIRSQKKQIIAANLQLTDAEAQKFWPLYDQYTAELVKINDAKYGAIKEYAVNFDTLTDEKALSLMRQILEVDQSVAQLRLRYAPLFNKIVPGKKTALFFQMDRRLVMLIDLQLASQIPMVQP